MSASTFIGLLDADDKGEELLSAIDALCRGVSTEAIRTIDTSTLRQVPGAPFAYWATSALLDAFTQSPSFESGRRTGRVGLQTGNDFRFVRTWWEVKARTIVTARASTEPQAYLGSTYSGCRWVPFAKGGAYSPFFADVHLLVDWLDAGREIREFDRAFIRNEQMYFHPGLTWPLRTQKGFSIRPMAEGSIFGHKGPAVFASSDDQRVLLALLGIMNSSSFQSLLQLQMAFGSYEVGVIQRTPVPDLRDDERQTLVALAHEAFELCRSRDTSEETTHCFQRPLLADTVPVSLSALWEQAASARFHRDTRLGAVQVEIDQLAAIAYGLAARDGVNHLESGNLDVSSDDAAQLDSDDEEAATETGNSISDQVAARGRSAAPWGAGTFARQLTRP